MNNTISIIIPAYNVEKYLASTLDSVLAQTYSNMEIIVVNDGSTDGTARIIGSYAARDLRVRAIHKENGGVTSARLRGVAEATGAWIGFVDGDDFIEPQMYEHLLQNALEHNADISHCGYQMVFPNGRVDFYYNTGRMIEQQGRKGCLDLLSGEFVEPGLWNKLYRRELFVSLENWMDTSIKINEDLLMNYYLFKQANTAVFEDVCPYHYLLRKGSAATSTLNPSKLLDPLKVTKLILSDAPAELQPPIFRRLTRQLITGSAMSLCNQPELIAPYRKECRIELHQRLNSILTGKECGTKLKIMALWAAIWPASYGFVHRIYTRISGIDKKYNLE